MSLAIGVASILLTRASEAHAAAERIRTAIEDLQIPHARNAPYGHVTTPVGVTTIGPGDLSADDASWLARTDVALYRAKTNGRNRSEAGLGDANPGRCGPLAAGSAGSAGSAGRPQMSIQPVAAPLRKSRPDRQARPKGRR